MVRTSRRPDLLVRHPEKSASEVFVRLLDAEISGAPRDELYAELGVLAETNHVGWLVGWFGHQLWQCVTFGGHLEILEVDELAALRRAVSAAQIKERVAKFKKVFAVQADCSQAELERAAKTSVALDRLVKEHDLGSLAYFYSGTGNTENEEAISSIIIGNSLLTARGIPVAGEYEVKNAQAMKILDTFEIGRAGRMEIVQI